MSVLTFSLVSSHPRATEKPVLKEMVTKMNFDIVSTYTEYLTGVKWYSGEDVGGTTVSGEDKCCKDIASHLFSKLCIYCGKRMKGDPYPLVEKENCFLPISCDGCGWWAGRKSSTEYGMVSSETTVRYYEGIVKSFQINDPDLPIEELRKHLERHPKAFLSANPQRFEELLRDVYKDYFDCEVVHVGGPGDNGIDLYVLLADEPILVQAKRRSRVTAKESVSTVRNFLGAIIATGNRVGHIVTTAPDFSYAAKQTAGSQHLARHGIELTLIPYLELLKMLRVANRRLSEVWSTI